MKRYTEWVAKDAIKLVGMTQNIVRMPEEDVEILSGALIRLARFEDFDMEPNDLAMALVRLQTYEDALDTIRAELDMVYDY